MAPPIRLIHTEFQAAVSLGLAGEGDRGAVRDDPVGPLQGPPRGDLNRHSP